MQRCNGYRMAAWSITLLAGGLACGCGGGHKVNGGHQPEPVLIGGLRVLPQDVNDMCTRMCRGIMAKPEIASRDKPPRVVIDAQHFENAGSQPMDKKIITDQLRVQLFIAASRDGAPRMIVLDRENFGMVLKERDLQHGGLVDPGTIERTEAPMGADFRLTGRIGTMDSIDPRTGREQRFYQFTFQLTNLQTGAFVWADQYKLEKAGTRDEVLR